MPLHISSRIARRARFRWLIVVAVAGVLAAGCSGSDDGADDGAGTTSTTAPLEQSATATPDDAAAMPSLSTVARSDDGRVELRTVSTRADSVTGGDVLVGVTTAADVDPAGLTLTRDGIDVTSELRDAPDGGGRLALVSELAATSRIVAAAGESKAELVVVDHPLSGPIFSGTHLTPFVCKTEAFGLGPATDNDCSAPTKVTWRYRTTAGEWADLARADAVPDDAATATVDGREVPFIVRTEQGVLNRSVYWITVLDPTPGAGRWSDTGWNRRLVYRFGGGCGTNYSQGLNLGAEVYDADLLGSGYAVATGTLNTFQSLCNDTISAETALMVREHLAETYGPPELVLGDGGSGGAIQQLQIAQNYPGILDGLVPSLPFPDAISISPGVTDCGLLTRLWATPVGSEFDDTQRAAIGGHLTDASCGFWASAFVPVVDASTGCDPSLADKVYQPDTNPTGVRCTLQDSNVNVVGRDPETGFARRPLDNTGVQYGLAALEAGTITMEQFVVLNEAIGGYDIDGRWQAQRETTDEATVRVAYETGRITRAEGVSGVSRVPVILRSPYTDNQGDIHTRVWAFAARERLSASNPNVVLWTYPPVADLTKGLTGDAQTGNEALFVLDRWLTAAKASPTTTAWSQRLASTRPGEVVDRCGLPDGTMVSGSGVFDEGSPCATAYPVKAEPRMAAGGPSDGTILKCAMKPVDASDYPDGVEAAALDRLRALFPDGVCDWTKPGVGVAPMAGTWTFYER
jgi:hypothetical protein